MDVILGKAGRAALRAGLVIAVTLAAGILNAPNLQEAKALATAASIAILVAAVGALRAFVPGFAEALAAALHVPVAYADVFISTATTFVLGFIALSEGVLSSPDWHAAKAAGVAGIVAIGDALIKIASNWLTAGNSPKPEHGFGGV